MSEDRLSPTIQSSLAPPYPHNLPLAVFLVTTTLFFEVVLRLRSKAPFLNDGLLHLTLFGVALALLAYLVAGLFGRRGRTVVVVAYVVFLTVMFGSQLVYYDMFQTYYTVFSAANAGQVTEFASDIFTKLWENLAWILLLLVPLVAFAGLRTRLIGPAARHTWRARALTAGLAAMFAVSAIAAINLGDTERAGAHDMYYHASHPVTSVNRLGLVTTMRIDLQRTVLGSQPTPRRPRSRSRHPFPALRRRNSRCRAPRRLSAPRQRSPPAPTSSTSTSPPSSPKPTARNWRTCTSTSAPASPRPRTLTPACSRGTTSCSSPLRPTPTTPSTPRSRPPCTS